MAVSGEQHCTTHFRVQCLFLGLTLLRISIPLRAHVRAHARPPQRERENPNTHTTETINNNTRHWINQKYGEEIIIIRSEFIDV